MDKTDRLRDYGLAFLLYEHGLGVCGYELIRELFIFIKLILNSYLSFLHEVYDADAISVSVTHYKKTSMDFNKARLLYLIVFFLYSGLSVSGQSIHVSGRVLQQNTQTPVEFANVVLFKQDSVFLKGTTTDTIGRFEFENLPTDNYVLSVSCLGFETKRILIQNLTESAQIDVYLNENVLLLGEVVISASSTINKINQRIVFPTKLQISHSANGMQLLNTMMLPGLNINPMLNTISSSDGGKVILQINGVNTTPEEIQTLQPRQIKRIEYSDYAGIRYGHASKVINYVVVRDDKGGVVGVDLMNSLNILAGGDVFFAKFNKGKSEYALNYTAAFQRINTNNRNRTGSYQFENSSPILREEISAGGDYSYQMHDFSLTYNYQQSDSAFFNAKLKYNLSNQPHNDFNSFLKENGTDKGLIFDGSQQKINVPTIDLYYQYGLPKNQKIYANVVGSYANAASSRNYCEYNDVDTLFSERSELFSDKYSLIAEGIYEKGFAHGNLKFGIKHIQSFTEQTINQGEEFKSDLNQAESSVFAEWFYSKGKFSYSLGLRLNRLHFSNVSVTKSYYHFLPKAMVGYRFSDNSFIRYDAEMSQTNPTLMELADTEIRLDSYLAEKGNLLLQPYLNLNNNLYYENRKGLFAFNASLHHHYKHNPIMESKREHGNVFLTMPENMKDWNKYNAEITLKVGMIKNFLQFSVTGGFNHFDSRGNNYSHTHSNFYYRADVLAMYKKWMLIGQLQPFDERLYGETVIKDGNYHYLAIRYNATNFSFGIGAFNPFKNVSRTIMENKNAQAPFRRESFSDASRILVATLTWNFNFGKTHLVGTKSLNNQDTDYGIKGSYK